MYFQEKEERWSSGTDICTVINNLALGLDTYVECECKHMSSYAVRSNVRDSSMVGYPVWFHISCFICMVSLVICKLVK